MIEINSKMIQELRDKTNAGFMKCKEALIETNGDMEKAVDWLRAQGIKACEKKSGEAKEGYFGFYHDETGACYVELLCATDFVAKNEIFIASANEAAKNLKADPKSMIDEHGHISKELQYIIPDNIDKFLSLKEGAKVGRYAIMEKSDNEEIYNYSHYSGGNKIAALVKLSEKTDKGKDIAIHIACANPAPIAISADQIDHEIIEKETESVKEQVKLMDKPENVKEKILQSRIDTFKKERSLLDQPFFKDPKMTVGEYLGSIRVLEFKKMKIGDES